MATVGQVTMTGGRGATIGNQGGVARAFTMPENGTLNHLGIWVKERVAPNANSLRGAIYSATTGDLVHQTNILSNPVPSTTEYNPVHVLFGAGLTLTGGQNYVMLMMASSDNDSVDVSGQNGPGGSPVFFSDQEVTFYPNFPSNLSALEVDSVATRQWDMWLDYSPQSGSTGSMAATESGVDEFDATGGVGSNGIRLELRDTDTGALWTEETDLIISIRESSDAEEVLYSTASGATDEDGVYELASGAIGNIGDDVYVTIELADHSQVAAYIVQVIDLNA